VGAPEPDFSFLVFGSIGAPNPGALILLKAKPPPTRHELWAAQGDASLDFRDLRGPRAGANNHERCLLDVMN
jgi:PhoPQ-activated pathogenicity-related protein